MMCILQIITYAVVHVEWNGAQREKNNKKNKSKLVKIMMQAPKVPQLAKRHVTMQFSEEITLFHCHSMS